jgi:hypothetical protein
VTSFNPEIAVPERPQREEPMNIEISQRIDDENNTDNNNYNDSETENYD